MTDNIRILVAVIGLAFIGTAAIGMAVPANDCAGTGYANGMQCSGTCLGQQRCISKKRTDVFPPHYWCGCTNLSADREYACCHLIQIGTDSNPSYSINGDCISCNLSGHCELGGNPQTAGCVGH